MALSAPLLTRIRVGQVKIEATKGTAESAGLTDLLAFDVECNPTAPFQERKGSGKSLGHSAVGVIGERTGTCNFRVELREDGAADMDAGIKILLQCCGLDESTKVYTPCSVHATLETCTIMVFMDGTKKVLRGCMGNFTIEGEAGKQIFLNFEFMGVWVAPTDAALPTFAPSAELPLMLESATFTLGGESIKFNTFTFNAGNVLIPRADVDAVGGIAYYMIGDRDPTFECDAEFDKIAGFDYYGKWLAGTTAAVSLAMGATITLAIPKLQFREVPESDRDGIATLDITGQCIHNAIDSGDDEYSITVA